MLINRNNYEEFFILYMDNELDQETRAEVEAFALAHPDLGEELELLLQTRFVPDQQIRFEGKGSLLKQEELSSSINNSNCQEWMLLQVDGELNPTQQTELAAWLATHPAHQKEMKLLLRTRLVPDTSVVFPGKETLYRHAEPKRAAIFTWRRIAVAASLLLAISTTALLVNRSGSNHTQVDNGNIAQQEQPSVKTAGKNSGGDRQSSQQESTVENTDANINTDTPVMGLADAVTTGEARASLKNKNGHTVIEKAEQNETRFNANNLPSSEQNPNMMLADNKVKENTNEAAFAAYDNHKFEAPENTPLTNSKQIIYAPSVTSHTLQPLEPVYALQEDAMMDEPGKKNKLRGFLRKVTRTFEKTTNLKATDPDDRLLIGGLAIQL